MNNKQGLSETTIVFLVVGTLLACLLAVFVAQYIVEQKLLVEVTDPGAQEKQYEISKLAAEIRKIRSDTGGSLFLLKIIALLVTVGGAVGGYLYGHHRSTWARIDFEDRTARARIDFESRQNVDAAFQVIVQELAAPSPLLRAAAVVKLGNVLESFPSEWRVSEARRGELIHLAKQVLAAALAIEDQEKVLKTLTIAIAKHKPWADDPEADSSRKRMADLQGIDLSRTQATDAYWAIVDFTYADFFKAVVSKTSFREAVLDGAQFREAELNDCVLAGSKCRGTNFKMADLRGTDLTGADLTKADFQLAKVANSNIENAILKENEDCEVDISESDEPQLVPLARWLGQ